jgi:hypothetical protein
MNVDPALRAASCREFIEDLTGRSSRKVPSLPVNKEVPSDLWYLYYKDEEGTIHTVKGSQSGIRRSLKEGYLGDASHVRASRSKSGPFETLRHYPEFRDLVLKMKTPTPEVNSARTPTPINPQVSTPTHENETVERSLSAVGLQIDIPQD